MQNLEVGQKVTINETMKTGTIEKLDFINVVVVDEEGNRRVLHKHEITPQSFLTENK